VKQKLERIQALDNDELFNCLQALLMSVDQEELSRAFQVWVQMV
jgi:hypothetical protein